MSTIKRYKVLALFQNVDRLTGIKTLVAELSPIEIMQGLSGSYINYPAYNGDLFIFLINSLKARQISADPERIIEIDLDEFKIENAKFKHSLKNTCYSHSDFIEERNKIIGIVEKEVTVNQDLLNAVNECILMHHTDMYFTYIYRCIIYQEYEQKGEKFNANLKEVFEKYKKLCAFALEAICSVQIPYLAKITLAERQIYQTLYNDLIEFGRIYGNAIAGYVAYRQNIKSLILQVLNDEEPMYPIFFQLCMFEGYKIALERINNNIDNKQFFDHELIKTPNFTTIKLYPTPYGFLMKDKIVDLLMTNKIDNELDNYFLTKSIVRIKDEDLKEKLRTRFTFKHKDEKGIFYYKRRSQENEYIAFGEQDRQNPFRAIIMQGQMNLTLTKEI